MSVLKSRILLTVLFLISTIFLVRPAAAQTARTNILSRLDFRTTTTPYPSEQSSWNSNKQQSPFRFLPYLTSLNLGNIVALHQSPPPANPRYVITNLLDHVDGQLDDRLVVEARSINDKGQVAAYYYGRDIYGYRGFVWSYPGKFVPLEMSSRYDSGYPYGALPYCINNTGKIVGSNIIIEIFGGRDYPAIWNADSGAFAIPTNSQGFSMYGTLTGINDFDQTTGSSPAFVVFDADGTLIANIGHLSQAAGYDGSGDAYGQSINNFGLVVGNNTVRQPFSPYDYLRKPFTYDVKNHKYVRLNTGNRQNGDGNGINNAGVVVGCTYGDPQPGDPYYLFSIWGADHKLTVAGAGSAQGINGLSQVVGFDSYVDNSNALLWTQELGLVNLNTCLVNGDGWSLNKAYSINNKGQIVGSGTYQGRMRAFLLTPVNFQLSLPASSLSLSTQDDPNHPGDSRLVDGVVCDNLRGMKLSDRDSIKITLPPGFESATIRADLPDVSQIDTAKNGTVDTSFPGQATYYPPDEFNENQTPNNAGSDLTQTSIRTVPVILHITNLDGSKFDVTKTIYIARPPVVLVHGINSKPSDWNPFVKAVWTTNNVRQPFAYLDHSDVLNGNGPVEVGANRLHALINGDPASIGAGVLQRVRSGMRLLKGAWYVSNPLTPPSDNLPLLVDFTDYTGLSLAIRRVDVVAWSYGGMITRWYLASDGTNPSNAAQSDNSWYSPYRTYDYNASEASVPAYNGCIRKVFTLGSMWRGVPFANYVNENWFYNNQHPNDSNKWIGSAPFNNVTNVGNIGNLLGLPRILTVNDFLRFLDTYTNSWIGIDQPYLKTRVPSMEVMAINSPWLSQLIYAHPVPSSIEPSAKPFNNAVAYGSVAGDNDLLLDDFSKKLLQSADPYRVFDLNQKPSWFPFLSLEYWGGKDGSFPRNLNDGIVPLWSAAIPGSYKIAPTNHYNYNSDRDTREYLLQWLNHSGLPQGTELNTIWTQNGGATVQSQGSQSWVIPVSSMAPFPQSMIYQQVPFAPDKPGIGRLDYRTIGQPVLTLSVSLTRVNGDIVATCTLTSNVLLPGLSVAQALMYSQRSLQSAFGTTSALPINAPGVPPALKPNEGWMFQVTFPGSLGVRGDKVSVNINTICGGSQLPINSSRAVPLTLP